MENFTNLMKQASKMFKLRVLRFYTPSVATGANNKEWLYSVLFSAAKPKTELCLPEKVREIFQKV